MANEFLAFAAGGTPNVLSQSAWAALGARTTGFQSGVAQSAALNKAWRQSAAMAAALGAIVDAEGFDALDNGDTAALANALRNALGARFGGGGLLAANGWQRLPGGLIVQWGAATFPASGATFAQVAVVFPLAFPNDAWFAGGNASTIASAGAGYYPSICVPSLSLTGATFGGDLLGGEGSVVTFTQPSTFRWLALGR